MLENLYTTKMSANQKTLQNRFAKIRGKNGRFSRLIALAVFLILLSMIACAAIVIAANTSGGDAWEGGEYAMTEDEFSAYMKRTVGAVMAELDYADETRLVFHDYAGLFVINPRTGAAAQKINLTKLNLSPNQQGSNVLIVRVSSDGRTAYLSSAGVEEEIKDFDDYTVDLDSGRIKKESMPKDAALFTNIADTFETVKNTVGWYSNTCVLDGDKIYYLTSRTGMVKDIELVTVTQGAEGNAAFTYVFENRRALGAEETADKSALYQKTEEYLKTEFDRVYRPYYDIQSLTISNWNESGDAATFFYNMTYLYYNRDPDKAEYIKEAKQRSQEEYEILYRDYLELKESNYEFKIVYHGDRPELYYNVAPKGVEWEETTVDDFILQ